MYPIRNVPLARINTPKLCLNHIIEELMAPLGLWEKLMHTAGCKWRLCLGFWQKTLGISNIQGERRETCRFREGNIFSLGNKNRYI